MSGKSFIAQLRTRPEKREELIALQTELKKLVFEQEPGALVYELFQRGAMHDCNAPARAFVGCAPDDGYSRPLLA